MDPLNNFMNIKFPSFSRLFKIDWPIEIRCWPVDKMISQEKGIFSYPRALRCMNCYILQFSDKKMLNRIWWYLSEDSSDEYWGNYEEKSLFSIGANIEFEYSVNK